MKGEVKSMLNNELKFTTFCRQIASLSALPTNITASGTETVQQTIRNQ